MNVNGLHLWKVLSTDGEWLWITSRTRSIALVESKAKKFLRKNVGNLARVASIKHRGTIDA